MAISERFESLRSQPVLVEDGRCPAVISPNISSVAGRWSFNSLFPAFQGVDLARAAPCPSVVFLREDGRRRSCLRARPVWASTLAGVRSSSSASAGPLAAHELSASPRTFLWGVAGCARGSDQCWSGARRVLTSKTVYAFEHLAQNLVGPMSRWRPGRGRIQANKVRPSNPAAPVGRLRHSRRWWSSKDGGFGRAALAFRGRR